MKKLLLVISHVAMLLIGFAGGIYALPILIAPPAPSAAEVQAQARDAAFTGQFQRNLAGSDALHWGEGTVSVGATGIALAGAIAPGPDYRLYLSPTFVETEDAFKANKARMVEVGPVKTFENFIVPVPPGVTVADYSTVIVWCETFGEFITAARYRPEVAGAQ